MSATTAPAPSVRDSVAEAMSSIDRDSMAKWAAESENLRRQFVERFPIGSWNDMPLESYALGHEVEGGTVCWWLEFKTRPIASISGGSAYKHLIFWSDSAGAWRYPRTYPSVEQAWETVRKGFVDCFRLAREGRFDEIDDIGALAGASLLRSKALYMYFPDEIVAVCSRTHVAHFLQALGRQPDPEPVRANRQLLATLRSMPELAELSTLELSRFLYHWADPRTSIRVVKIAPGEQASMWDDCWTNSYVCVGWDLVGDLSLFQNKEEFREAFREHYPYNGNESQVSRKANELWTLMELEPGDKVIANRGTSEVVAVGTVNDIGYAFRPEQDRFKHTLGVDWGTPLHRHIEPIKAWATTTVHKVSPALLRAITGVDPIVQPVEFDHVYLDVEQALERRGQVILYGPPGTGKTYTARRAAVWLLAGGSADSSAAQVLNDPAVFAAREAAFSTSRGRSHQVWFMVANPSNWSWSEMFDDGSVDYSLGRLRRNFPRVRAGDLVVGYESTPTKRVVALARVTDEYDEGGPPESALRLEPVTRVRDGLSYEELQSDDVLSESEPVRFRCQGTLFALSTVEADRVISLLADRDPNVVKVTAPGVAHLTRITFHPSYTYEDFVEGFRPTPTTGSGLQLDLADGVFKQVCQAAAADPDGRYVVLIDEINRGNIPKIFGELITLLEKDKRGLTVRLPQSGAEFAVPRNVLVIATMNTADRSIHLLDTALRRRFAFVELLPDTAPLQGATVGGLALDVFLDTLNDRVRERVGREKQVGHALFFSDGAVINTPEEFAAVFRYELLPLLQEYLYEDYTELAAVLGPVIDTAAQRPSSDIGNPELLCTRLAEHFQSAASA